MKTRAPTSPPLRKSRGDRGDQTREKLLKSSVDVFGRYGFDGSTTRMLADAAGVNLQAIPYHFGGKEGLYIASAEYIGEAISSHVAQVREEVRGRLAYLEASGQPPTGDEARKHLTLIAQTMVALFVSKQSEPWARFLIREQMEPTEAFARVYGGVMKPMLELVSKLVGVLLDEDPLSTHIRLRTLSFVGSILVYRMAHAAALAHLGWDTVGPREVRTLQDIARELVDSIGLQEQAI